jgi:hypothetical protein
LRHLPELWGRPFQYLNLPLPNLPFYLISQLEKFLDWLMKQ